MYWSYTGLQWQGKYVILSKFYLYLEVLQWNKSAVCDCDISCSYSYIPLEFQWNIEGIALSWVLLYQH